MAHIGIVGGGLMGCATALHLLEQGHSVTVLERDAGGLPASVGNAGILAVPEINPLARPDMLATDRPQLVGLLTEDPAAPLEEGMQIVETGRPMAGTALELAVREWNAKQK